MKFNQPKAFEQHVRQQPHFFYLILTEEEGFREWAEKVVLEAFRGATVQRLDRLTKEKLSLFLSPSLFGDQEVFIAPLEDHETIPARFPPGRALILHGKRLLSNTKLFKEIDEKGVIFQLPAMKPYEKEKLLMDWLMETAVKEKKSLAPDVAKKLVEMQEGHFDLLQREWEKIVTYVGDRKAITADDLQKIGIRTPKEEVFSFVDAMLRGDGPFAIKRLQDLLALESSPIALLKLMRSGFQNLMQVHSLVALGHPPEAIQKDLPYMQGRILEQLLGSARKTNLKQVQSKLYLIDQLETEYKNGSKSDAVFLDYVVSQILNVA